MPQLLARTLITIETLSTMILQKPFKNNPIFSTVYFIDLVDKIKHLIYDELRIIYDRKIGGAYSRFKPVAYPFLEEIQHENKRKKIKE